MTLDDLLRLYVLLGDLTLEPIGSLDDIHATIRHVARVIVDKQLREQSCLSETG